MTTIREMQKEVHQLAREKGWHDDYAAVTPVRIMAWLMLITTETAEAAECVRRGEMTTRHVPVAPHPGKPVGLPSELADIAIRLMDTAEALGIDLQEEIEIKHAYNKTRTARHGGKVI